MSFLPQVPMFAWGPAGAPPQISADFKFVREDDDMASKFGGAAVVPTTTEAEQA